MYLAPLCASFSSLVSFLHILHKPDIQAALQVMPIVGPINGTVANLATVT
jgi:hypothetical protein